MRSKYRNSRKSVRRSGRRTSRTKKLVDGRSTLTKPERYLAAGASTAATVAQLARSVGTIMSMINVEKKFLDTASSGVGIDYSGFLVRVTAVPQGDGDSARNGNTILAKDLTIRYKLSYIPTSGIITNTVRVMIVVDKEDPRGVTPTLADVIQTTGNAQAPYQMVNMTNSKRFAIVKTKMINLNTERRSYTGKTYVKLPFHVYFTGTDTSIASADQNHVYVMFISDVLTDPPSLIINNRFTYYDN